MIDIHTHILPGIDDGCQNPEESIKMIQEAYENGFTDIITTSHYIFNGSYNVNKQQRKEIIEALQSIINARNLDLTLYNGAEAYITPELSLLFKEGIISTLADSKYVLFELPLNSKVIYTDKIITDLRDNGYIPIIAHPERYEIVQKNPDKAKEWIDMGAYLQCNYASILGRYGIESKKTIIKLLKKDLITFLGTDCHSSGSIYNEMDEILHEFKKYISKERLSELTTLNAKKVINNELI